MADVARVAGVSPTTVSFVINGRPGGSVGAETAQRVRDAIARLDYRPNLAAQTLRTRRTRTIGFITDEIAVRPPAGQTISGAHDAAQAHGSRLLIIHATANRTSSMRRGAICTTGRSTPSSTHSSAREKWLSLRRPRTPHSS